MTISDRHRNYVVRQKRAWDESADITSDPLQQVHFFVDKNPYESIHAELDYYLHFHNGKVLKVGCGNGLILEKIHRYNKAIWGVDISANLIAKARRSMPDISDNLSVAEASHLSFRDSEFDTVFAHSIFQYFPDFEYSTRVIDEMLRVCKPGGKVFLGDLYNRRLKNICERYHALNSLFSMFEVSNVKKAIYMLMHRGNRSITLAHNYIDPGSVFELYRQKGTVYLLLIWSDKPELCRKFRYNVMIEKRRVA